MHTIELAQKLENFRQAWTVPFAVGVARLVAAPLRPVGHVFSRFGAAVLFGWRASFLGRCVAGAWRLTRNGLAAADRARCTLLRRINAAAARSRAACRAVVASVIWALLAIVMAPGRLAAAAVTAGQAALEDLRAGRAPFNSVDATIALLFALALFAPFAAERLSPEAQVALGRAVPLIERPQIAAERGVSMLGPDAPTLWTGVRAAQAERDAAPPWVEAAADQVGPLSPAEALLAPPRRVELEAAPLWSPALAALTLEDEDGFSAIETASIPESRRAFPPAGASAPRGPLDASQVAALELGAFDTGPTRSGRAPQSFGAGSGDDVSSGSYATASVERPSASAWPAARGDGAPTELFVGASHAAPPSAAPLPSPRPNRVALRDAPRVTVVLTAVGLNAAASRAAFARLPSAIAFAVPPVAERPADWLHAAQASGRVALLEMPMEPVSYPRVNPGPLTLLADASAEENLQRLAEAIAAVPGADGVASYLGGRFTSIRDAVDPVVAELRRRDLFLLETHQSPLSQLRRSALAEGLTAATSIVSLDRAGRADDLSEGFARLEEAAKVKGEAIGVAVAVPSSVQAIAEWAKGLERRGIRLTALPL
ncbi:MAG: divergent polysaccharide deacetylase family protein [Pseudomonadota bacterium]